MAAIPFANLGKRLGIPSSLSTLHILSAVSYLLGFLFNDFVILLVLRFFNGLFSSGCVAIRNNVIAIYPDKADKKFIKKC